MGIKGAKAHVARLNKLVAGAEKELGAALYEAGFLIEAEAALSITRGSVSGKGHVASAPGEAPNRDTGVLDRNIETTQPSPLRVKVSSNAPYAAALEFETSKMAARPYMRPARDKMRPEVEAKIRAAAARLVKKSKPTNKD